MASKSTKKSGEVREYPVLGAIRHDGEWVEPGEGVTIMLTEIEAVPLIDGGSLGEALAPAPAK